MKNGKQKDTVKWVRELKREILELAGEWEEEEPDASEEWVRQAQEDREELWKKILHKERE